MKPFPAAILLIALLSQCNSNTEKGAVAFTFDDQYISEWIDYSELFKKYDIRATFFISRPQLLDPDQVAGLRYLAKKGHEIACHGLNHLNANDFAGSAELYLSREVAPAARILDSLGFKTRSFAYPFGDSPGSVDTILLENIGFLRKATWNKNNTTLDHIDEIFASEKNFRLLNSIGLDYNYMITLESVEKGLKRAKDNDEVLVFHAHKIDTARADYVIDPGYLEEVFKLCRDAKVKSVRIMDLEKFFGKKAGRKPAHSVASR